MWDDSDLDRVPVADPTLPAEVLSGKERRRQKDPLGQGHIQTWRTFLIKVAGAVSQSTRRIWIIIPSHRPHLSWFRHVCQRIKELSCPNPVPT